MYRPLLGEYLNETFSTVKLVPEKVVPAALPRVAGGFASGIVELYVGYSKTKSVNVQSSHFCSDIVAPINVKPDTATS